MQLNQTDSFRYLKYKHNDKISCSHQGDHTWATQVAYQISPSFRDEAARLASLNQTEMETCEQLWIEGVPPGHDVVTNPTFPQPGFTLPIRPFVTTLNRLRCGQARCAESLYRWDVIASPAYPRRKSHQTARHIVDEFPLTAFSGGLRRLHEAGPDAVEWLSKLSMKLWECSKRTTTTLIKSGITTI